MSVRTRILGFFDVILRVPPLFLLDEIFKIGLGLPIAREEPYLDLNITKSGLADAEQLNYDNDFYRVLLTTACKFIICCIGEYVYLIIFYEIILCVNLFGINYNSFLSFIPGQWLIRFSIV